MRRAILALALLLSACAVPPPESYVAGRTQASGGGLALGRNAVGEACTEQPSPAGQGATDVYCGSWQQPSGSIRPAGRAAASELAALAVSGPWRAGIDQRFACGEPRLTTILDGMPAAVMACTRRQGGWPHMAFVSSIDGNAWTADGVLTAFPAIERAVGVVSGRLPAEAATTLHSSGADALLADRMAAQAFASGDIGQYDDLMVLGSRANQAERFAAAENAFRAALLLQEKALGAGNPNTATTLERLALQVSNQGHFADADGLFARATSLAARSDDPLAGPRLQHNLALHLLNKDKPDAALAQLVLAERGYTSHLPASVLTARPVRLVSTTGFDTTLESRQLIADPTVRAALVGTVEVRRYRAVVLRVLGRQPESDAALADARALAVGNYLREPVETGRLLRTAGAGALGRGERADAADTFATAAATFGGVLPDSRPYAETLLLRAAAIDAASGLPAALAACREGTQILRQEAIGVLPEVLGPCLNVLAAAADADPAHRQQLLAAMFEAAQLSQGGVTETQIAQATARLAEGARDPKVGEAIRRRQDAAGRLTSLTRQRDERAQGIATEAVSITIDADIVAARTAVAEAEATLQAASPNYGQLVQEVVPASAVLSLLKPGEVFVSFHLGATGGWTFALRDNVVTARPLATGAANVARLVQRVRTGVEPTTDAIPPFDTKAAAELYTAILGSVSPQLDHATGIVVAPTGPLLSIPFGLLLTGPGDPSNLKAAPWLLRNATVAHVPAAANFVSLRKLAASRASQPWFGFGAFRPTTLAQARRSFPGADCAESASQFAALPPLPYAGRELEAARLLLGGRKQDELLGPAFTAAAVLQAPLKDYRILHFATHALLPAELRCQPEAAIVTSAPAGALDAKGSLLTVSNVVDLDLDADTVILSACNSGGGAFAAGQSAGGRAAGESLSGLARAFFYAGARSLMVTHWSVNDQAAAYLVAESMRRVHAGASTAEALRQSQLAMLDGDGGLPASLAHPFFWAPFALIGDGGGRAAPGT